MKPSKVLLLFSLFFIFLSSGATGINFQKGKSWKDILLMAKKENKLIFLDAYTTWCGPCKYLQSKVFTDNEVGVYFNKTFINVKIDMEDGEGIRLAGEFDVQAYPTLLFINADGKPVHKKVGAMEAKDFLHFGQDAINKNRQYFTIKSKAAKGEFNPEYFHRWIHDAEEMEDPDADSLITRFLNSVKSRRMEKEILEIMLDHASLDPEQTDFLFTNREACMKVTGRTTDEFNASFLNRVVSMAARQSLNDEIVDFSLFQKTVEKYFPEEALTETKKMKIRYYHFKEDDAKCLDELAGYIAIPELKLNAGDLASFVITYSKVIGEQERVDEFIQKILQYKLLPGESAMEYNKNLSLLVLYLAKNDAAGMKEYSDKILFDKYAPETLKSKVKNVMENKE
jgi:thiol-disulfide isomerase/thioredoxin